MLCQKMILEKYMYLYSRPTVREIASQTGIQATRVFRLFNGAVMKLTEYEIFKKLVDEKNNGPLLESLAEKCLSHLSLKALKDIENAMKRKLELHELKNNSKFLTV